MITKTSNVRELRALRAESKIIPSVISLKDKVPPVGPWLLQERHFFPLRASHASFSFAVVLRSRWSFCNVAEFPEVYTREHSQGI